VDESRDFILEDLLRAAFDDLFRFAVSLKFHVPVPCLDPIPISSYFVHRP
jgi:hypothetical protein